jgi:hypothetical protein
VAAKGKTYVSTRQMQAMAALLAGSQVWTQVASPEAGNAA